MRGAHDRGLAAPDVEVNGAARKVVRAPAEQEQSIAALCEFARDRAADTFGGSEYDGVQGRSPNSRIDCALRITRSGSQRRRTASNAAIRGSIFLKCSGRVNASFARYTRPPTLAT